MFLRIARALVRDIRQGRLKPGALLPGSRALAVSTGVHRNTVLAAYRELTSEGWIESSSTKGTFVAASLPESAPRRFGAVTVRQRSGSLGFTLRSSSRERSEESIDELRASRPKLIALAGGLPDMRHLPVSEMARAYRRVLIRTARSRRGTALGYTDASGHPELRDALAQMLGARRGLALTQEEILVTRGSQMALDLIARVLMRDSTRQAIAVESPGYAPAWAAFRGHGATLVPIPVDEHGLSIEALERHVSGAPIAALYLTPHHQYPTTVTLSAARRIALLRLAKLHRFAIIEDDYDHEFHYEGRPVLPLASADQDGLVVYVGTLSKILAPAVRVGYVCAPKPFVERLVQIRSSTDRQGDPVLEGALAELMRDGALERHAGRMRRKYLARRDHFASCVAEAFGQALSFDVPRGGMSIWASAAGIDVERWASAAFDRDVLIHTGRRFSFDGRPRPFVRLGFACVTEAEARVAIARLRDAFSASRGR